MNPLLHRLTIVAAVILAAVSAHGADPIRFGTYSPEQFTQYWYHSGAELSRFRLEQVRYGEIHKGDAVQVFVTEEMNPAIQVKADHPGPRNIRMLKLNAARTFFTGIYPYSILTSVFTPVDVQTYPLPLKISTSAQEWCGHVYTQMNLEDDRYRVRMHSYFETEGDRDFGIKNHLPEDAIWTMIRIAPQRLPRGEIAMIPGTVHARFAHRPLQPEKAFAVLEAAAEKSLEGRPLVRYEIRFPEAERLLRIFFEKDFPYRIQKWEEVRNSGKGANRQQMTTRAVRTHTLMDAYWRHNKNKDRTLLKKLGLKAG